MPTPKPITTESLKQDLGHIRTFLLALDAVLPGHIDETLLSFVSHAEESPLTLGLLAQALARVQQQGSAR